MHQEVHQATVFRVRLPKLLLSRSAAAARRKASVSYDFQNLQDPPFPRLFQPFSQSQLWEAFSASIQMQHYQIHLGEETAHIVEKLY